MRIFSVGDIHGEYNKLSNLLFILGHFHCLDLSEDKIIFMGDMVDRGPDSYLVIKTIKQLCEEHPKNVIALKGNHEQMMLDFLGERDRWELWLRNGGQNTIKSFIEHTDSFIPEESVLNWLKNLPLSHEEPGFFFSHAPVPKEKYRKHNLKKQPYTQEELTWTYSSIVKEKNLSRRKKDVVGVCGHIHALFDNIYEPRIYSHYIFTDAGCGCSPKAPLCAVEVVSRQVVYSV